jgi:hypothetical protein
MRVSQTVNATFNPASTQMERFLGVSSVVDFQLRNAALFKTTIDAALRRSRA